MITGSYGGNDGYAEPEKPPSRSVYIVFAIAISVIGVASYLL